MAKKPKPKLTVQVGPFPYEVYVNEGQINALSVEERQGLMGHADHHYQRITVSPNLAVEQAQDTVLHEVLHCVLLMCGLAPEWGPEVEESVVRRLTPLLLMVIKDNPALIEWLCEE